MQASAYRWCPTCFRVELSWGECPSCGYKTPARVEQDTRPKKWHRPSSVRGRRKPKPARVVVTQDGRPFFTEYKCPLCQEHGHTRYCELCNGHGVVSRLRLGLYQGWVTSKAS